MGSQGNCRNDRVVGWSVFMRLTSSVSGDRMHFQTTEYRYHNPLTRKILHMWTLKLHSGGQNQNLQGRTSFMMIWFGAL